jgi:hypothetical protein
MTRPLPRPAVAVGPRWRWGMLHACLQSLGERLGARELRILHEAGTVLPASLRLQLDKGRPSQVLQPTCL